MIVKTRFAPSPTGYLHIGGVRTALFSWAFARHHKGEFLLRIEDTDLARSTAESVNIILDGMKWVGLDYDNADNVVYQTRRFDRYKEVIAELLEKGAAYYCYCSKEELEAMREKAEKEGTATYDRRWRHCSSSHCTRCGAVTSAHCSRGCRRRRPPPSWPPSPTAWRCAATAASWAWASPPLSASGATPSTA